jgi:hypothetical protein
MACIKNKSNPKIKIDSFTSPGSDIESISDILIFNTSDVKRALKLKFISNGLRNPGNGKVINHTK